MPNRPVRFDLGASQIACPHCRQVWDDADLGLDDMTIESCDDIDHCVPQLRDDEHVRVHLRPRR